MKTDYHRPRWKREKGDTVVSPSDFQTDTTYVVNYHQVTNKIHRPYGRTRTPRAHAQDKQTNQNNNKNRTKWKQKTLTNSIRPQAF